MSRLYRSTRDKMFTGLIGGLSDYFGVESTLLRFIFVISIFFTGGTTLLIYLIASLVVPKEPYYRDPYGGPGGYDGGYRYNDGRAATATETIVTVMIATVLGATAADTVRDMIVLNVMPATMTVTTREAAEPSRMTPIWTP